LGAPAARGIERTHRAPPPPPPPAETPAGGAAARSRGLPQAPAPAPPSAARTPGVLSSSSSGGARRGSGGGDGGGEARRRLETRGFSLRLSLSLSSCGFSLFAASLLRRSRAFGAFVRLESRRRGPPVSGGGGGRACDWSVGPPGVQAPPCRERDAAGVTGWDSGREIGAVGFLERTAMAAVACPKGLGLHHLLGARADSNTTVRFQLGKKERCTSSRESAADWGFIGIH